MRICVMQASSRADKNSILYECTREAAMKHGHEVVNLGVLPGETESYSYIEIALEAGLLLMSGGADFIVTGCSSGQGMMLALNKLPGVLCGYLPTPQDAFLFGRINGGNAVSLPLGLNYGWMGEINLSCTLDKLFDGDFGTGWPPEEAARKRKDNAQLHELCEVDSKDILSFYQSLDEKTVHHACMRDAFKRFISEHGTNREITEWVTGKMCVR